jgi:phage terminase small subunit
MSKKKGKLNRRQRAFIVHYTGDAKWNGAEAARLAGYSERAARITASRLLTNANIQAEIEKRLTELALSAGEILVRLGDQATSTMQDFITIDEEDGTARIDLKRAAEAGKLHLVKKFSDTTRGQGIELYDQQAALVQLGKYHKLWTERHEIGIDKEDPLMELLREIRGDEEHG